MYRFAAFGVLPLKALRAGATGQPRDVTLPLTPLAAALSSAADSAASASAHDLLGVADLSKPAELLLSLQLWPHAALEIATAAAVAVEQRARVDAVVAAEAAAAQRLAQRRADAEQRQRDRDEAERARVAAEAERAAEAARAEALRQQDWRQGTAPIPAQITAEDELTIDGARAQIRSVLAALERVKLMSSKRDADMQEFTAVLSTVNSLKSPVRAGQRGGGGERAWTAPHDPADMVHAGGGEGGPQPAPANEWLRDEALASAERRLQLLSADIAQKQALIQQYLGEADERMDALRACGHEIVALRQQVRDLGERNQALVAALDEYRARESQLFEAAQHGSLAAMPDAEVRALLKKCASAYQAEKKRRHALEEQMRADRQQLDARALLERNFQKLTHAHTEQAAFVQRLQEENGKLDRFKTTIKNQEQIIARLEEMLEAAARRQKEAAAGAAAGAATGARVRELEEANAALRAELKAAALFPPIVVQGDDEFHVREITDDLRARLAEQVELTEAARGGGGGGSGGGDSDEVERLRAQVAELQRQLAADGSRPGTGASASSSTTSSSGGNMELVALEERCKALESELGDAARRNAKVASELKTRLMRKEMLLRMNNIVDEDDAMGGGGGAAPAAGSRPASRFGALAPLSR